MHWAQPSVAGLGAGVFASAQEACASLHLKEQMYLPDSADRGIYDRLYHEVYQKLYPTLSLLCRPLGKALDPTGP